eukprot:8207215-Heterocapsa_arctica.AAC.1
MDVSLYEKSLDDAMDNVGLKELFEKLGAISPAIAPRTTRTSARDSATSAFDRRIDNAMKTQLKVIKAGPSTSAWARSTSSDGSIYVNASSPMRARTAWTRTVLSRR